MVLPLVGVLSALLLGLLPTPASAASVEVASVSELDRQAAEIEAELAQAPRDEALLAELTKTRVEAADALVSDGALGVSNDIQMMKGQLALAERAWQRYLKVAEKPSPELAELVAPAIFRRAELAKGPKQAETFVKAAAKAQRIVTASRPSEESWTTLSYYELFAQHYDVADQEIEKALADTKTASERASLEKTFEKVEKAARKFGEQLKPAH